jgi:starch synthase
MNVLLAASECTPFAKVGGLGDVIGALPQALVNLGVEAHVILPLYKPLLDSKLDLVQDYFDVSFLGKQEKCRLFKTHFDEPRISLYLIENQTYLSSGGIYLSDDAIARGDDEPRRFLFFCKAVYTLLSFGRLDADIVHCHDWHTSLLCKLIHDDPLLSVKTKTVLSVHNLANKGVVGDPTLNREIDGIPHSHAMIAVGLQYADRIVPVSETYAAELIDGQFCDGLEDVVSENKEKIVGITNGIDVDYFNPETDPFLSKRYDVISVKQGKIFEKDKLLTELGWGGDAHKKMLFGFVGRVVKQKNIELMVRVIEKIQEEDLCFVFLGVGEPHLTELLQKLAARTRNSVYFANRFDEGFARQIYAASDAFLVPSYFEPCGLTQMIAMRYGSIPVARRVGGLADTILNGENGFLFDRSLVSALHGTILKAHMVWRSHTKKWDGMIRNAMARDFSWEQAALQYVDIYTALHSVDHSGKFVVAQPHSPIL